MALGADLYGSLLDEPRYEADSWRVRVRLLRVLGGLGAAGTLIVTSPTAGASTGPTNWPQYLGGPDHSSFTTATTITKTNAASLHLIRSVSPRKRLRVRTARDGRWLPDPRDEGHG